MQQRARLSREQCFCATKVVSRHVQVVSIGHSAMSAQCPVCPEEDIGGRFYDYPPRLTRRPDLQVIVGRARGRHVRQGLATASHELISRSEPRTIRAPPAGSAHCPERGPRPCCRRSRPDTVHPAAHRGRSARRRSTGSGRLQGAAPSRRSRRPCLLTLDSLRAGLMRPTVKEGQYETLSRAACPGQPPTRKGTTREWRTFNECDPGAIGT